MSDIKKSPPDWAAAEREKWRENAEAVPRQVARQEEGMMKRIRTYCGRFGYGMKKVTDKIGNDGMFAACFSKTPSKQGMHERIAAEYLEKVECIGDFEILPKGGKGALFINARGEIMRRVSKPDGSAQDSKSLDFRWKTGGYVCYASHKYTHESGGAQDHQFRDQKRFLENFQKHGNPQAVCFAVCDGAYYTDKKMRELGAAARKSPPLSFAAHIEEVEGILRGLPELRDNNKL